MTCLLCTVTSQSNTVTCRWLNWAATQRNRVHRTQKLSESFQGPSSYSFLLQRCCVASCCQNQLSNSVVFYALQRFLCPVTLNQSLWDPELHFHHWLLLQNTIFSPHLNLAITSCRKFAAF